MTNNRTDKIEAAVCDGAALVSALMEVGPLNSQQASLIIEAAVKAAVPNVEFFEICESARRIIVDLEKVDRGH